VISTTPQDKCGAIPDPRSAQRLDQRVHLSRDVMQLAGSRAG
jgi:hypothetical protein